MMRVWQVEININHIQCDRLPHSPLNLKRHFLNIKYFPRHLFSVQSQHSEIFETIFLFCTTPPHKFEICPNFLPLHHLKILFANTCHLRLCSVCHLSVIQRLRLSSCLLLDPSGAMEALVHGGMSPGSGRFVSHSLADCRPSQEVKNLPSFNKFL